MAGEEALKNGSEKFCRTADAQSIIKEAILGISPSNIKTIFIMSKRARESSKITSPGSGSGLNHTLDVISPEPKKRYIFGYRLLKIQVTKAVPIENLNL